MLEAQRLVAYLKDACTQGERSDVPFSRDMRMWELPMQEARVGALSTHTTRQILLAYSNDHADVAFGERTVPVVCCIRSLKSAGDTGRRVPLLLVAAGLTPDGRLEPRGEDHTWIPAARLSTHEFLNESIAVCDIDAYLAHKTALRRLPADGTWTGAFDRAIDLFDAVSTLQSDELAADGLVLDDAICLLRIWDRPFDHDSIASTLSSVEERLRASDGSPAPAVLKRLLLSEDDAQAEREVSQELTDLPNDLLLSHKVLQGVPDHLGALHEDGHAALGAFGQQEPGDIMLVEAAKGTPARELALAALANLYTEHALRGDRAPVVAIVSDEADLQAMADLLNGRPQASQASVLSRWLPRIATTQGNGEARRRVLGPLGTLCLAHSADGQAPTFGGGCLCQPFGHLRSGDPAAYADAWYVPKATIYFLDMASHFLRRRVESTREAMGALSERLRLVDQERCELIDAYDSVCKAAELDTRREELLARIGRLRRGHANCRERLRNWEEVAAANPVRRPLFGSAIPNQEDVIAGHRLRNESLAEGCTLVSEVCERYRQEIERIESSIDRLRGATANLSRRIHAAAPEGKLCAQIMDRLSELCALSAEERTLLESALAGRSGEVTLEYLDRMLDQTVRPAEFWLAVHVYEARWLDLCQQDEGMKRKLWNGAPETLAVFANLAPVNLVPRELATSLFLDLFKGDLATGERGIDLLIASQGQGLGVLEGIGALAYAQRSLVVGDPHAPSPAPVRSKTYDELACASADDPNLLGVLQNEGMALSGSPSLFDLACKARCAAHKIAIVSHANAEVIGLRSELLGVQIQASVSDGENASMRGNGIPTLPALSYVLVPDSSWAQKGPSRQNRAEALAMARWLANHASEIVNEVGETAEKPMGILVPYAAQAEAVQSALESLDDKVKAAIDVCTLADAQPTRWPMVLFGATTGPDNLRGANDEGAAAVLELAAACAIGTLVLFCGGSWVRCLDPQIQAVLSKFTRVGRLFSTPRKKSKPQAQPKGDFRVKPLSLTALLERMCAEGDIETAPPAAAVNRALHEVGLIERASGTSGRSGWKPTAAGREAGILATSDRLGNPFCAYTQSSRAVVASLVGTLEPDTSTEG